MCTVADDQSARGQNSLLDLLNQSRSQSDEAGRHPPPRSGLCSTGRPTPGGASTDLLGCELSLKDSKSPQPPRFPSTEAKLLSWSDSLRRLLLSNLPVFQCRKQRILFPLCVCVFSGSTSWTTTTACMLEKLGSTTCGRSFTPSPAAVCETTTRGPNLQHIDSLRRAAIIIAASPGMHGLPSAMSCGLLPDARGSLLIVLENALHLRTALRLLFFETLPEPRDPSLKTGI